MVNYSSNINTTNKYLLPQIIEKKKQPMTYAAGNQGPVLNQSDKCGGSRD